MDKLDTTKQLALITGVSRVMGLGYETAIQLAGKGYKVIITSRDPQTAQNRAAELVAKGLDVVGLSLDVNN
jgi:NAD(P)-dependent dehydrogenase (short-subunit alcohol dehydrogenase family)